MKLIHVLLKKIYQDSAVVFNPVALTDVQRAVIEMVKNKAPKLPPDYMSFLTEVNGFYWNGIYMFGLYEQERAEGSYMHPGILETYSKFLKKEVFKNRLVLGYAIEEIITYNASNREYQILSRYDYRILYRFPRFFDVLYYYVSETLSV